MLNKNTLYIVLLICVVTIMCYIQYLSYSDKQNEKKIAEKINKCTTEVAKKYESLNGKDLVEYQSVKSFIIAYERDSANLGSDIEEINIKIKKEKINLAIAEHALIQRVKIIRMINESVAETPEGFLIHFVNAAYENKNSGFTTAEHYILEPMNNPEKENGIDYNNWSALLVNPGLDGIHEAQNMIIKKKNEIKNDLNYLIGEKSNLENSMANIVNGSLLKEIYPRFKNIEATKRNMESMREELSLCISNSLDIIDREKNSETVTQRSEQIFYINYDDLYYTINKYKNLFEQYRDDIDRDTKLSEIENIQPIKSTPRLIQLVGFIDSKIKISMSLMIDDLDVAGYYHYDNIGQPISLRGNISQNGDIVLEEFPGSRSQVGQVESSGKFQGKISEDYKIIDGNWISKNTSYEFNLDLYDIDEKALKLEYVSCLSEQDENCKKMCLILISTGDNEIDNLLLNNNLDGYAKDKFNLINHENPPYIEYNEWISFISYKKFKSYIHYASTDTGGVHSNSAFRYYTIDKNLKTLVNLSDCISDKYQFIKIINNKIKKKYNFIDYKTIEDNNSLPKNFYFCNYGIGIVYNRYELGSYTDGPLEIIVPWKDINYLFNRNFLDF